MKNKKGHSIVIPDKNGNRYIYTISQKTDRPCHYVRCAFNKCEGRGKIDRDSLEFLLIKQHNYPFFQHNFYERRIEPI